MNAPESGTGLPPEIQALIREVLDASGLDFVDGHQEVARELRAMRCVRCPEYRPSHC